MTVQCSWCQKIISGEGLPVSHGICPECLEEHFGDVEIKQLLKTEETKHEKNFR